MHILRNKIYFLVLFVVAFSAHTITAKQQKVLKWEAEVGSKMQPPQSKTYLVNDYGISRKPDLIVNTNAIQAAIDACSENGGGIVKFQPGIYLSGAIFLKNNVNLQIDEGVELRAIQDVLYYPELDGRIAGIEMKWPSAFINVIDQQNVAISGKGVIHGQGRLYWEKYWNMRTIYEKQKIRWAVDYDCKRVRSILISNSSHISLSGVTVKQSGFWSVHVLYSSNITVDGITIRNNIDGRGPSTDGIDIDSSTKILVENCDVDCNDDNYCLKAGRDADGLRVNKPTEYVVIRNCISRTGAGLITIGSETSGSIRHVHAYNLKAIGTDSGIKLKSALTRGGTVEHIYFNNIQLEDVGIAISLGLNWNPSYSYSTLPKSFHPDSVPDYWITMLEKVSPKSKGIPKFRDLVIDNLTATNSNVGISANGMENSLLESFHLANIDIKCKKAGSIRFARDWTLDNVVINDHDELKIENSSKIEFLSTNQ